MHVRVVRFTDVDRERMDQMKSRIDDSEGPPPGSQVKAVKVLLDADQGTAVVLQYFDSAGDLAAGEEVFAAMDPSDTPGTRASVDRCETVFELEA